MNDIERQVRELPWRQPSKGLRQRIFAEPGENPALVPSSHETGDRKVSVKLSWAVAVSAAFVGFVAGAMLPPKQANTSVATMGTDIRVVETSSLRNSFDFSSGGIQILPGEFTAYVDGEAESVQ